MHISIKKMQELGVPGSEVNLHSLLLQVQLGFMTPLGLQSSAGPSHLYTAVLGLVLFPTLSRIGAELAPMRREGVGGCPVE